MTMDEFVPPTGESTTRAVGDGAVEVDDAIPDVVSWPDNFTSEVLAFVEQARQAIDALRSLHRACREAGSP